MKCATCDRDEARHIARLDGDEWPVCTRCREQGERYSARLTHRLMDEPEEPTRPADCMWDPS